MRALQIGGDNEIEMHIFIVLIKQPRLLLPNVIQFRIDPAALHNALSVHFSFAMSDDVERHF